MSVIGTMAWIDPALLQLLGMGTEGDPYLQDGRHLRWSFGRLLGFPRSGFALKRRPSLDDPVAFGTLQPVMAYQEMSPDYLGSGSSQQLANGLGVSQAVGFKFARPWGASAPCLRIHAAPVTLTIGPPDTYPKPGFGPTASDPAAYVMLTIYRRANIGSVVAEGSYSSGGTLRFQDRTAVGADLLQRHPQQRALIADLGHVQWMRSRAERFLAKRELETRHNVHPAGCTGFFNPWLKETMILSGGLLEHITITGKDALLASVTWLSARSYAQAPDWAPVGEYFLPLTDAASIYPAWTSKPGKQIAAERLAAAPPRALAPWDVATFPPPPDAAGVAADQRKRYLDGFARIDFALRAFLEGELISWVPQAEVEIAETMQPIGGPGQEATSTSTLYTPFDFLYASAADPQMARLLGLMASDLDDPHGSYDYCIGASFPTLWLWLMTFTDQTRALLKQLRAALEKVSPGAHEDVLERHELTESLRRWTMLPAWNTPVISMATAISRGKEPLPSVPGGFTATPAAYPPRKSVQCEVSLGWNTPRVNFFEEPRQARIFYALRRSGPGGEIPLHERDDASGVALPIVPTSEGSEGGRAEAVDRTMPEYGSYTYRLSGMDLWGRFSPFAEVSASVVDLVPPLAPTGAQASLAGSAANAPAWSALVASFEWSLFQAAESPDVAFFEIHVRQGKLATAASNDAKLWQGIERAPGVFAPPLRIDLEGAVISTVPAGLTAAVVRREVLTQPEPPKAPELIGHRYEVTLGPITAPFTSEGFTRMSATARAVDAAGNASPFALRAIAERANDTPPEPITLQGPTFTSYPDARGLAHYCVSLETPAGRHTQVLRASQASLLQAGGITDAAFEQMTPGERVELLRKLAVVHDDCFTRDHLLPYSDRATSHDVVLQGLERTMTVLAVQQTSATGVDGAWPSQPDAFAVISVRRPPAVRPPEVIATRPGDRSVQFELAADPTGATRRIRVFRTRDAERTNDLRTMRPIAELEASTAWKDGFADGPLYADVPYFYRFIAIGDGRARSEPTPVIAVKAWSSVAPAAASDVQIARLAPSIRRISFTIARRDQRITIFRRDNAAPGWQTIDADLEPGTTIDLKQHTVTPTGEGYAVLVDDPVPDGALAYSYFIRVHDALGRHSDSPAVKEPS